MRAALSMGVKCVPLKSPGKYSWIEPPRGAPGFMEMARTQAVVPPSIGISTKLGHSYLSYGQMSSTQMSTIDDLLKTK